jgi:hypothetical protein
MGGNCDAGGLWLGCRTSGRGKDQAMQQGETWYPQKLRVKSEGTPRTYNFMQKVFRHDQPFSYAEFGIWRGDTALRVCERFPAATLYLFDFDANIEKVKARLDEFPNQIHYFGNSERFNDSYNWSLGKLMGQHKGAPIFDYCFLDGAHTFAIDALNYFLCDRLLRVGGYMDFDDYTWKIRGSSLDPMLVPAMSLQYTDEQIATAQVEMIVEHLVRTDPRYEERVKNKVFCKIA